MLTIRQSAASISQYATLARHHGREEERDMVSPASGLLRAGVLRPYAPEKSKQTRLIMARLPTQRKPSPPARDDARVI